MRAIDLDKIEIPKDNASLDTLIQFVDDIKNADEVVSDYSIIEQVREEIESYIDLTKPDCQFDQALRLCLKIIDKYTKEAVEE